MYEPLKRQNNLDAARGLAAVQVMGTHYISAFYPYAVFGGQGGYVRVAAWQDLLFFPPFGLLVAGNFAVCVFFVLSGYVLSYRYLGERYRFEGLVAAMIKRPIRLGGLVLFAVIASALLWAVGGYFNSEASALTGSLPWFELPWKGNFEFNKLLWDVGLALFSRAAYYNPPLWTIKIELYGSAYVFIFLMIFGGFRYRAVVVMICLFMMRNSPYFGFFAGVLLADIAKNHYFKIGWKWLRGLKVLAVVGAIYFSSYPSYLRHDSLQNTLYGLLPQRAAMFVGYPMLAAILVLGLIVLPRSGQSVLGRPVLLWLGRVSYALYAIHFLWLGSCASWVFLQLRPLIGYDPAVLVAMAVSFPMTLWLSHWITIAVDLPAARLGQRMGCLFAKSWVIARRRWLLASRR